MQINYMSLIPRKRFFGVHAPDSPACVHVDTETNTSPLILDTSSQIFNAVGSLTRQIFGDYSISAGLFSISVAKKHRP